MTEFAEFLRRHRDLVRTAAAEDLDMPHRARRQGIAGVRDDVAAPEFLRGLGENARHVQCDIAIADHRDAGGSERGKIGRAHVELQSLMRISYAVFCLTQNRRSTFLDGLELARVYEPE